MARICFILKFLFSKNKISMFHIAHLFYIGFNVFFFELFFFVEQTCSTLILFCFQCLMISLLCLSVVCVNVHLLIDQNPNCFNRNRFFFCQLFHDDSVLLKPLGNKYRKCHKEIQKFFFPVEKHCERRKGKKRFINSSST